MALPYTTLKDILIIPKVSGKVGKGVPPMFNGIDFSWHWSPITLIGLVILCLLYSLGLRQARKHNPQAILTWYQITAFISAIVLIALVLLTPIDTIARTQLFIAHMVQFIILTTVCAPLLLAACPDWFLRFLLGQPIMRPLAWILSHALVASLIFNITFFVWHAPALYNLALARGTLYHVELLSLLGAAILNWWPLIGPVPELRPLSYPMQMLYAFLDGQPVDIFAFLLVFSGAVFYHHYVQPLQLGVSAYGDQATGGALLLIPGLVDLVVMSPLFFRWLALIEERTKMADQRREEERLAAEAEAAEAIVETGTVETSEAEA